MAGNYPDVPSWRMAYDVDGTQLYSILSNVPTQRSVGNIQTLNNSAEDYVQFVDYLDTPQLVCFIFPELRDLDAWFILCYNNNGIAQDLQVSTNTTNGVDGTWSTIRAGDFTVYDSVKPAMRTGIQAYTALGIKAIRYTQRFGGGSGASGRTKTVHLYGELAPGVTLQRLEIWHPTLDQRLGRADFDWGDVPRNSTATRQFRIKNMHGSLTANSVRAAMSIATDTTPSVVGQMAISKDGTTWGAQQTLSSPLGPGAISPILYHRRTTPSNAVLSLWDYRVFADCSSWT